MQGHDSQQGPSRRWSRLSGREWEGSGLPPALASLRERGPQPRPWASGIPALLLVALLGIATSVVMFWFVRGLARSRAEANFQQVADQRLVAVRANVTGVLDTVGLLASHFEATSDGGTSRRAFATLVAPALTKHHYLQALEWIPWVEQPARSAWERRAREDGIANFTFVEPRPDGGMGVAIRREEYFPVFYVEPLAGNEKALGYNLGSNPVRLAALCEARDTGRIVASARVRLVQEKGDQYGTLVFAPVYHGPTLQDVSGRRKFLKGFVLAVLRTGDFIAEADARSRKLDALHLVDVHLFDMTAAASQRQLYPTTPEVNPATLANGLHVDAVFEMGGRSWLLVATPGSGYVDKPFPTGFVVLVCGLLTTGVYVTYLAGRIRRAEQIAESHREIRRLNRALSTLSTCGEAVVHAADEASLLQQICEILVHVGDFRLAWVGYAENDRSKTVRLMAKAGFDDGYTESARITWDETERGRGPTGTAIRTGKVCIARSTLDNPDFAPWREEARRRGYGSNIALPLRTESETLGALAIYAAETDAFDAGEVELLKELANDLSYGIRSLRNEAKRRQVVAALKTSEERYRTLFEHNLAGVFRATEGKLLDCNEAFCRMLGYSREEMLALDMRLLYSDLTARDSGKKLLYATRKLTNYQVGLRRKDGSEITVLVNVNLLEEEAGTPPVLAGVVLEVTEVHKLQEQLAQSQRLEAVGKLTGGIAHDFNNILMIINSYGEIALDKVDTGSPLRRPLEQIRIATDRAASLTRQLLAFSRKQVMSPVVLNLGSVLSDLKEMLKRLIGEDIALEVSLSEDLWLTKVDPSQIEQVVFNLAVNARDAMPRGGRLSVQAANLELGDDFVRAHPGANPGQYVAFMVSDTGCGMSQEVQSRIFEPFFTTKEPGKGTGLGLSTVYGIVKQSGGYITVESQPGKGTTFSIYLPRTLEPLAVRNKEKRVQVAEIPHATILLVEDEDPAREAMAEYLELNGFRVVAVSSAQEALRTCQGLPANQIDVLLTDVVMPGMSGIDLAGRFQAQHPSARVVFMSGYTDDILSRSGMWQPSAALLSKPFSLSDLADKLKEILTSQPAGA